MVPVRFVTLLNGPNSDGDRSTSEGLVFTLGGALDFSYVRSTQLFPRCTW